MSPVGSIGLLACPAAGIGLTSSSSGSTFGIYCSSTSSSPLTVSISASSGCQYQHHTMGTGAGSGSGDASPSGGSGSLSAAVNMGRNPQMCGECCKVFTSSSALAKHKLTHSDERRYSCNLCHKRFKRQDHLNGHKLTHSATKPFVCNEPECGKSYCDQRQLKRHLANQHGKLEVDYSQLRKSRLFSPSNSNSTLVAIQGVNGAETQLYAIQTADEQQGLEKQSTCPVCNKIFPTLPALNGHMRLHGGYDKESKEVLSVKEKEKPLSQQPFDLSAPLSVLSTSTSCSLVTSPPSLSNSSSNVSSPAQPLALTVQAKPSLPLQAAPSITEVAAFASSHVRYLDQHDLGAATTPLISALRDAFVSQSMSSLPASRSAHINVSSSSTRSSTPESNLSVVSAIPNVFLTPPLTRSDQDSVLNLTQPCHPGFFGPEVPPTVSKQSDPCNFEAVHDRHKNSYESAVEESDHAINYSKGAFRDNEHRASYNNDTSHVQTSTEPQLVEKFKKPRQYLNHSFSATNLIYDSKLTDEVQSQGAAFSERECERRQVPKLMLPAPAQSALKSPFAIKSPGPSKSVHFVFPPLSSRSPITNSWDSGSGTISSTMYSHDAISSSQLGHSQLIASNSLDSRLKQDTCVMSSGERDEDRNVLGPPPPYDSLSSAHFSQVSGGLRTPSAIPKHLHTARQDYSQCSRNRSYSVDERALRPKPDIDEFLSVCDEFIAGELEKMNRRQSSARTEAKTRMDTAAPANMRSNPDKTERAPVELDECPNISPSEKEVVTRLASNMVEEAAEISIATSDEVDEDDDDAFLPPGATVTAQTCANYIPPAVPPIASARFKHSRPGPLNIPKTLSNFTARGKDEAAEAEFAVKNRSQYYQNCLSASFAVDNNDNSLFAFSRPSQPRDTSVSHAMTGLLTPDRLDELFPDEPVLRRNSVATFPCRLDEENSTTLSQVPVAERIYDAGSNTECSLQTSRSAVCSNTSTVYGAAVPTSQIVSQSALMSGRRHSTSEVSPSKLSNSLSPPGIFKIPGSSVATVAPLLTSSSSTSSLCDAGANYDRSSGPPSIMRRSFKPKPIHIPKHISTGVFRSCLKSPRTSVGGFDAHLPYTPPPMLTPKRSGPGLFAGNFPNLPIENRQLRRSHRSGSFSADFANLNEPELEPKINVGSPFQADLPALINDETSRYDLEDKAVLVWAPMFDSSANDLEIDQYLSAANSCCVNGGGGNTELAFHALAKAGGSVKNAMKQILARRQRVPFYDPLEDYHYQNSAYWSCEEREIFNHSWSTFGKDFCKIKSQLPAKRMSDIVEYYYSWKLINRNTYKKNQVGIKAGKEAGDVSKHCYYPDSTNSNNSPSFCSKSQKRRKISWHCDTCLTQVESQADLQKHIQHCHSGAASVKLEAASPAKLTQSETSNRSGSIQNTVSKVPPNVFAVAENNRAVTNASIAGSPKVSDENAMELSPASNGHFPCEICRKVFTKVKSRNAHMKMHRHQQQPSTEVAFASVTPVGVSDVHQMPYTMSNVALDQQMTPPPLRASFTYPKGNSIVPYLTTCSSPVFHPSLQYTPSPECNNSMGSQLTEPHPGILSNKQAIESNRSFQDHPGVGNSFASTVNVVAAPYASQGAVVSVASPAIYSNYQLPCGSSLTTENNYLYQSAQQQVNQQGMQFVHSAGSTVDHPNIFDPYPVHSSIFRR